MNVPLPAGNERRLRRLVTEGGREQQAAPLQQDGGAKAPPWKEDGG